MLQNIVQQDDTADADDTADDTADDIVYVNVVTRSLPGFHDSDCLLS